LSTGSKPAVLAALVGNLAIAVFKLIAALVSGSSAMLAEAYHSFSDTFNQVFLLVGIWRSKKPPDRLHPFGYGKEQFFWAFIVSLMLFGIAGGLSIREAYHKFRHPEPLGDVTLGFIVLAVAFVIESIALAIAVRQFRREMKSERFGDLVEGIQHTKDPAVLTVVFEDSLALVSIAVAFVSILLSVKTHNPVFDACGSLIIGIFLMVFRQTPLSQWRSISRMTWSPTGSNPSSTASKPRSTRSFQGPSVLSSWKRKRDRTEELLLFCHCIRQISCIMISSSMVASPP